MKQDKLEAARKAAAIKASKKLFEAADALNAYLIADIRCGAERARNLDDGRRILMGNITEYAGHLDSVFNKERTQ